ncbi:hypothetical protein AB685_06935 [Bacillus sp. LL01]|uniref:ABC transporter permease n=1 Tax=Bacillus sp. LL01 TaxID=1665556 RepID=UPI00064CEF7B|nr:ABC transporter permease [Bacillus sp. LL01]KMJ58810.1 hypothetical protein AB685_06935 [Bacillus sp. LL01]
MKFLKQLQLEGRFIFKNWFFLIAPLIYGIGMTIWMTNHNQTSTNYIGQYASSFFKANNEFLAIGHTLSLGVIFLASVLAIRREKQTVLLDWTNSLPNSNLSIILAKYLALVLYSSIFTLIFFITFLWQGSSFGRDFPYLVEQGLNLSLQSQLSYGVSVALGMVLAVLISNRIVYIIVFCAWMFGTFFMEGYIIQRYHLYFLKTFHLNQFFLDVSHSDDWGYRLSRRETTYSQLFVLSFSLFLLAITIIKSSTDRISSYKNRKWAFFGLVTVLTVSSFFPYGSFWADRLGHYDRLRVGAVDHIDSESEELLDTVGEFYNVDSYSIEMERLGNSEVAVHTEMIIPKNGEQHPFHFSLYPTFEVESVWWNGVETDFLKENHLITLPDIKQQETNRLEVIYSGNLNEWGHVYGRERYFAFLNNDDMYFPSYIGWYPLPGDYPVYTVIQAEVEDYINTIQFNRHIELNKELPVSDFNVELKNFDHKVFGTSHQYKTTANGSQIYTSENAKGITLLSNKGLVEKEDDLPFSIIAHTENIQSLQQELSDMTKVKKYFKSWLGEFFQYDMKLAYIPSLSFIGADTYYFNHFDEAVFFDDSVQTYVQTTDGEVFNNTMTDLKAQLLSFMLFGHRSSHSTYYSEDSVMKSVAESYLLVLYKDFYDFEWEEFDQFNGTQFYYLSTVSHINWMSSSGGMTTLEKFDDLIHSHHLQQNELVVLMVAKEIEKGNMEEVKKLLKDVYQDVQSNNKESFTHKEWMIYWNRTFESGGMQ